MYKIFLILFCLTSCTHNLKIRGEVIKSPYIIKDYFHTSDGEKLKLKFWHSKKSSEIIIIGVHGYSDYSNSFSLPANFFSKFKIDFYSFDLRGFGSHKNKGLWYSLENHIFDLKEFYEVIRKKNPEKKIFLLGESMGGAIIAGTLNKFNLKVDGIVLVSPAIWDFSDRNFFKSRFLWILAKFFPRINLNGKGIIKIKPSNNKVMLKRFSEDPLVVHKHRADSLFGITKLMDETYNMFSSLFSNSNTRIFLAIPLKDEVIPRKPIIKLLENTVIREQIYKGIINLSLYENNFHMILRDLNRERVTSDIKNWILEHKFENLVNTSKENIEKLKNYKFFHLLD